MFDEHPLTNEEYEEFKEFMKEYNKTKRMKKEDSLLYYIYKTFISKVKK